MSAELPVRIGDVLAGKYRVDRILGSGGMGVVVAATHLELEQRVALKFLLPEAASNAETVERFLREARAMARVTSEHIVRVADVGRFDGKTPYIVMEHLAGRDLYDYLRERRQLSLEDATEIILQACEAIAEAHSLGIVHRDLKPANLFLSRRADGSRLVKVLDFGLAKETNRAAESLTHVATVMGTPGYMSPEQLRSTKDVDERGDVWAVAVILYELLTGRAPFDRPTMAATMLAIATDPVPPLSAWRPDLPLGVGDVLGAALHKDRSLRTPNIVELATALAPFAPGSARVSVERISNLRTPTAAQASLQSAPTVPIITRSDFSSSRRLVARRSARMALLACVAATLVVGAAYLTQRGRGAPASSVTRPSASALEAAAAPSEIASASPSASMKAPAADASGPPPSESGGRKPTSKPKSDLNRLLDTRK